MKARTLLILPVLWLVSAAALAQQEPGGRTTPHIAWIPFTQIRVTVGPRNVVFTFEGPPNAAPRVMIVNGPLRPAPGGALMFDGPPLHLKAVKKSGVNSEGLVEYIASSELHRDPQASDQWLTLVPASQYYYFIFERGSRETQEGRFTTEAALDPPVDSNPQLERADPPGSKPR